MIAFGLSLMRFAMRVAAIGNLTWDLNAGSGQWELNSGSGNWELNS